MVVIVVVMVMIVLFFSDQPRCRHRHMQSSLSLITAVHGLCHHSNLKRCRVCHLLKLYVRAKVNLWVCKGVFSSCSEIKVWRQLIYSSCSDVQSFNWWVWSSLRWNNIYYVNVENTISNDAVFAESKFLKVHPTLPKPWQISLAHPTHA